MTVALEGPESIESLYLARGRDEVSPGRPLMTGDVLEGVEIPGLEDGEGLVAVMAHPCSMRSDGRSLVERLVVARVAEHAEVPLQRWEGHLRIMPLPALLPHTGTFHAVYLDQIGLVPSSSLETAERVACLSPRGVCLLYQRFIKNLTRLTVPTATLHEQVDHVFVEADLQEEWVNERADEGIPIPEAVVGFEGWIRTQVSGVMRQQRLREPQLRAGIRAEMRRELQRLHGTAGGPQWSEGTRCHGPSSPAASRGLAAPSSRGSARSART